MSSQIWHLVVTLLAPTGRILPIFGVLSVCTREVIAELGGAGIEKWPFQLDFCFWGTP